MSTTPRPLTLVLLVVTTCAGLTLGPAPASARPEPLAVGVASTTPAAATRPGLPETPAPARGVWPLHPRPTIVERFDPPLVTWGAGHRGVDLLGHAGQPVRAARGGRVSFVGRVAGRPVVVVDHGGTRTTYQPVLASRRRGEQVQAGDVVGRLVASGSHCPPRACLHWGLRRGEAYLDPLTLVDTPRPVRLLPW